jgi:hypothetical protein
MQKQQTGESDQVACSVLVVSCDRYRDLWTPFFTLLERHWPDCGMPIYLGTNSAQLDRANVRTLKAGDDEAWSRRLRFFLKNIDTNYVLLMLEDFFLDQPVSTEAVEAQLHLLHSLDGTAMRLFPNTPADYFRNNVGVLHRRAAFRVSLQAAIWNRSRLLELLVDEESPWAFEIEGTQRSQMWTSGFYCAPHAIIHYRHVVERGEWFRSAARFYVAQNIGCDFTARPVMGLLKACQKKLANWIRRIVNKAHSCWLCICYPEKVPNAG